jgi:O-antigen/teichoic acid export membrane protein
MDHVIKVTFPAFSRMQDAKEQLERSATRSLFFICFLVFPSLVGLLVLAPSLVAIIPRYSKWEPALIPLALIAVNTTFAAVTTQLTNLLNATGRIKVTFKLMMMWTALTWLLVPFLSLKLGVNGAALGYALVGASSIVAIVVVRRYVKFSLFHSALKPFVAALAMGAILILLKKYLPLGVPTIAILITAGVASYMVIVYLLIGVAFKEDVKKGFKTLFAG